MLLFLFLSLKDVVLYGKNSYTLFGSLQKHGKKIGSLDDWLSDASQPFNIYAHHSSVLKVKFSY